MLTRIATSIKGIFKPKKADPDFRYRSAITGRFVKQDVDKRYPYSTVRERVKK